MTTSSALTIRPTGKKALLAPDAATLVDREETSFAAELTQIREIGAALDRAAPQQLAEWIALLEAGAAVARLREAAAVAREATIIRARAQRRVGVLGLRDPVIYAQAGIPRFHGMGRHRAAWLEWLAVIPEDIFEGTLADMAATDCLCKPIEVLEGARLRHLAFVEETPGGRIFQVSWATDENPFYIYEGNMGRRRRFHGTLEEARAHLYDQSSLRVPPARQNVAIDQKHGEVRRLALELSKLGENLTGDQAALVGQAELRLMEAAELLWRAWRT